MARRKRPYHHGDLRAAMVSAATALLEAEGPLGVSLREAARKAGVSHAAPYRHFRNKEALLAAVAEEAFRGMAELTEEAAQRHSDDAVATLRELAVAYLRFATDHPSRYRLMFSPAVRGRSHAGLREAAGSAWVAIRATIAAGQRAGRLRAGDPEAIAFVLLAELHGIAMFYVDRQLPPNVMALPVATLADYAINLVVDGLTVRSSSAAPAPR